MALQILNTQSGQKEAFVPINPERVTMYVCGPTVYNYVHIGNARPIVVFDTLFRLLQREYPTVVYARNLTDVDDKINKAAAENGESIRELTNRFISAFHEDVERLNTLPPSVEPRATEHIPQMIAMVQALVDKEHAYVADGHVLFSVGSMEKYGRLSHRDMNEMLAGARVDVADYKRHPGDFVLWKPSSGDQPGWESPWGYGRPGWHLECSAMIETHLGDTIDIHGGGQDLIFPHHENEIAQSCCAHDGKEYVHYWMHNGYITVSGEKMSKSVGNFFTLRDVLQLAPGEAIRLALLSGHYRSPLDWSPDNLKQAKAVMDGFYTALRRVADVDPDISESAPEALVAALEDDLNTPVAISELHQVAKALNKTEDPQQQARLKQQLLAGGALMGLLEQEPEHWFRWKPDTSGDDEGLSDEEIEALIVARKEARDNRDFQRADEIRDQFADAGIVLEDGPQGTTWKRGG
ncbi:MAG: cysteine--tRNA ligase [bacterium]